MTKENNNQVVWNQKYCPKSLKEIVGQDEALAKLKTFVLNFKKIKKQMAIIYGPSGSGLTSSVYALAKDFNLEVVEINASQLRNKEQIDLIVKPAVTQVSLFGKSKIILIDDVDCITGKDRGCSQELIRITKEAKFPIILSANDVWQQKLNPLRNKAELIEFKKRKISDLCKLLKNIAKKEKLKVQDKVLLAIASKSAGDVRAAINDLQTLSYIEKGIDSEITEQDLKVLGYREKENNIFNALRIIFKTKDNEVIHAFDNLSNMKMDEFFLWVDANLTSEYKYHTLERAYKALSNADIYRRRIYKRNYWRFLVYINLFLTLGIALAKDRKNPEVFTKYKRPSRLLKIWWANRKAAKQKEVAEKIAKQLHISKKRARQEFNIYKILFLHKNKEEKKDFIKFFKLSPEQVEYLES